MGTFAVAMLAHELRVPLGAISGALAAMENVDALPEQARKLCALMQRNVAQADRLVSDGLDLARSIHGALKVRAEVVDLHEAATAVLSQFEASARERRIALRAELSATSHHVRADPLRLSQVLWNLVQNAMKFTPAGGQLLLRTASERRLVRAEVIDDGRGMNANQLERIFLPFVQESGREALDGGLGLGLYLCKTLVESQGGRIRAESAGVGRGSRFSVELRAVKAARAPAPPRPRPSLAGSHPTVLLVDDHLDTLEALGLLLRQNGYRVRTAASLEAALDEARHQIDLVISDLSLPDGSGIALMRQLRSQQSIEGIAVSGFGSRRDVLAAKRAGFRVHLTKPVPPAVLLETVVDLTRARAPGRGRDTRRA